MPTAPRIRIDGPVVNPAVVNFSTGERLRLTCSLSAAQYVEVLPDAGNLILLDGITPSAQFLNPSGSTWWMLRPGRSNVVRLAAASYSAGAQLTVRWRDAFTA